MNTEANQETTQEEVEVKVDLPVDELGFAEPTTIESPDKSDIEIEVVDDRPEGDQVAKKDPDAKAHEEELEDVSDRVQKRIDKLKYDYHEERRAKESAERMRDESVRYAQQVAQRNQELQNVLSEGEKVFVETAKSKAQGDLDSAERDYKLAYEAGDTEAVTQANKRMMQAQTQLMQTEQFVPTEPQQQPTAPQQQAVPQPDPKAQEWLQKNTWFGQDKEMTSFAYGVHEKLVTEEKISPMTDEYYEKVNSRMRQVFPDKFDGEETSRQTATHQNTSTVVAPSTRNNSGKPRKMQLTATQVSLARRIGLTPEQYAKQLLKEMSNG